MVKDELPQGDRGSGWPSSAGCLSRLFHRKISVPTYTTIRSAPFSVRAEPDPSLGCRSGQVSDQNGIGPNETRWRRRMDGSARRRRSGWQILVGLLFCGTFCAGEVARAQTSEPGNSQSQARSQDRNGGASVRPGTDRRGAGTPDGQVRDPGRADPAPERTQRSVSRIHTPDGREATPTPRSPRAATRHRTGLGAIVPGPCPPP